MVQLLDPVPTSPLDENGGAEGDEFWFNEGGECYLKLDLFESSYAISWPTEYSMDRFLSSLPDAPQVSPQEGTISFLAGERDGERIPARSVLDRGYTIPGNAGYVGYALEENGKEVEVEWFEYEPRPQIAVYSDSVNPSEFQPFFEQTRFSGPVNTDSLEQAYAEAVEQVQEQGWL
ncbi:MAG: hypothetical protein SVU88_02665 [Candidatus Nanohaloarchaea archaeon]|nr:hypothetical protein [Candidatus Nanohaloarchaea archaeon]